MRDVALCAMAYAGLWIIGVLIAIMAPIVVAGWLIQKAWRQI